MAPIIELLPALCWTCDACGRDNYERVVVWAGRLPPGVPAGALVCEPGREYYVAPPRVTCGHCGACFRTDEEDEA